MILGMYKTCGLTPYLIKLFLMLMEPVAAPVLDVFINVFGVRASVFT
jgi:hypothetical protein